MNDWIPLGTTLKNSYISKNRIDNTDIFMPQYTLQNRNIGLPIGTPVSYRLIFDFPPQKLVFLPEQEILHSRRPLFNKSVGE